MLASCLLVALTGCSTIPRATSIRDSLLVLIADRGSPQARPNLDRVVIDGPTLITANFARSSDGLLAFRVKPGIYTLRSRALSWPGRASRTFTGYKDARIEVRPATIVLPLWKFRAIASGDGRIADSIGPVTPADRRKAASFLSDTVRTVDWAGRNVAGIAPYTPFTDYVSKDYDIRIRSTPPGAVVRIDREDWGQTPVTVKLPAGSHFVRLSHPGYAEYSSFIDVAGNGNESFDLRRAAPGTTSRRSGEVSLMIEPFQDLGAPGSQDLSGVLTDSLGAALREAGLQLVPAQSTPAPASPSGDGAFASAAPDFAAAAKAGAEAFVAGEYLVSKDSILIHAALYDTRTHLVKTSLLFNGKGGLDIFDSIDLMSKKFSVSLEKVLPEVGQTVVQERVISPEAVGFSRSLARQEIIAKREAHKYAISVGPSLVGVMDKINLSSTSTTSRVNGPAEGLYVGFDAPIKGALSLHLATMPFLFPDGNIGERVEIPVYFGPRITFPGYMSNVFFGLQGALHYAPVFSYSPSTGSTVTAGPFLLTGVNFETGARIYTYQRTTQLPSFIEIALTLGAFGYRFDLSGASQPQFYPMEIGLRLLWGTRL